MQIDFEKEYWTLRKLLAVNDAKVRLLRDCYIDGTLNEKTVEIIFPEWKAVKKCIGQMTL